MKGLCALRFFMYIANSRQHFYHFQTKTNYYMLNSLHLSYVPKLCYSYGAQLKRCRLEKLEIVLEFLNYFIKIIETSNWSAATTEL